MALSDINCPNCDRKTLAVRGVERQRILCTNSSGGVIERQGCYGKFFVENSLDKTIDAIKQDYVSFAQQRRMKARHHGLASGEFDFYLVL